MANLLTVLGILVTLLIALFPYLRKTFFQGPELTIEFKKGQTSSNSLGVIYNSLFDGLYDMRKEKLQYQYTWNFEIIIRNNSEYTAYYPKIFFKDNNSPFLTIENLNEQQPIGSKEKITLKAVYQEIEETTSDKRSKMIDLPIAITETQILLEYKNDKKTIFYTLYNQTYKSNDFFRRKPKIFRV